MNISLSPFAPENLVSRDGFSCRMDQPGKVANPACGQLNRENDYLLSPFAPENLVSRDGCGRPVLCQPARSPH